jgi:hypothetical protein
MKNLQVIIEEMIKGIDAVNAEYILIDNRIESKINTAMSFNDDGNEKMVNHMLDEIAKATGEFDGKFLTPKNVKVGDGVTMHMYSDAHAGTIVKVTKTSVTVQRDKAKMDPNFKPEFEVGGFAGHCTNQDKQVYTYEQDPNGQTTTFRWSAKYGQFRNGKMGTSLTKGRREFYDYNF